MTAGPLGPVASTAVDGRLYFRQLLAGRDFATDNRLAREMVNFVYLIGDRGSGQACVVDPAYGVDELLELLEADEMTLTGVLATHYHADHVGGDLMGLAIEGVRQLLERRDVPVHVQREESPWVTRSAGLSEDVLVAHDSGDIVTVGELSIELIHTPGHTPGSQCFLVADRLVAGDTLFLEGCGRTDLPGSDPEAMYLSLTQRLGKVPDETLLFPGHRYSMASFATMGATREMNYVFRPATPDQWLAMFGQT